MATTSVNTGGGFVQIPQLVRSFFSREVFILAQPRLRFLQFAKVRRDLQAVRGKTIVFVKYNNLVGGGAISEQDNIVPEGLSASEVTITVTEHANAIQVTEYLLKTSLYNTMEDASRLLANNFSVVLDSQLRDAVLATTNVVYGNEVANSSAMDTTSKFNAKTVRAMVEVLANANTPKINGEFYVCFASPHQLRSLREDPEWLEAHKYMGRRQLYLGEAGMYEGVIFIETTQMANAGGSPGNLTKMTSAQVVAKYGGTFSPTYGYEAVMFGDNTLAWGIASDVELRDDGVVDLGRKHTLGWYGIWGSGLLENSYAVRALTV